ncbi:MAG: ROK family protein [Ignavibacteria bacterium]|jgi:glucokinase|nr:ROK family protein [Ignavibacteria bacterium]HEX2964053.1 ROK family protein [Ignavibacteriales bacterium]MCU7499320.1 ROK family protein [Ignavibacteria bacterium]MCU7512549.1 ROK family protein [Ignavibacteria bacterium]MCU7519674.1 ROK family protein [Ignavibacteria bacterium]
MAVIGLDLGGTKLAGAIFSNDGKIIHKEVRPLEKRRGKDVGKLIQNLLLDFFSKAEEEKIKIEAVGACIPGISWSKTGKVWAPNIPEWDDYPLKEEIVSVLPDKSIKVDIDSDRACYILGEAWSGAAKGLKDAIFLAVGTGIGAGIMIDGRVLRGSNDIAGAIGWLALDRPFQQKYVSCGCFEYHASGEGIAKVAREFLMQDKDYHGVLGSKDINAVTAYDVFAAYKADDPIAVKTLKLAVEFWGMTVANLVSLFNPEKIIFGGGVFGPAVQFLDDIMQEARKWAQPISINQVTLSASEVGGDAGLIGAGYLALRSI